MFPFRCLDDHHHHLKWGKSHSHYVWLCPNDCHWNLTRSLAEAIVRKVFVLVLGKLGPGKWGPALLGPNLPFLRRIGLVVWQKRKWLCFKCCLQWPCLEPGNIFYGHLLYGCDTPLLCCQLFSFCNQDDHIIEQFVPGWLPIEVVTFAC